jgi:hypothetical protein
MPGVVFPYRPANSVDGWLQLCVRYRGDAQALLESRRYGGAWLNAGFAIECCLKAAIMQKERFNRWPGQDTAPDLWTHNLSDLFGRLGIDKRNFDTKSPIAPMLKTVLDWRRDHGYSIEKVPFKNARDMCAAAFDGGGVIEWIASKYQLNI